MNRACTVVALSVLLTACGGTSEEATEATTTTVNGEAPPSNGRVEQQISALKPSELSTQPGLVSALDTDNATASVSSGQVTPSAVARQEALLSELNASRNEQGIVVSVPELVLFDFGKSDIRPDAQGSLDKVVELLGFYPTLNIVVEGHTDDVGSNADNQKLSEARSEAVRQALVGKGAAAGRLTAQGFGETQPVAPNSDDAGRQKNRRVEIVFQGA